MTVSAHKYYYKSCVICSTCLLCCIIPRGDCCSSGSNALPDAKATLPK